MESTHYPTVISHHVQCSVNHVQCSVNYDKNRSRNGGMIYSACSLFSEGISRGKSGSQTGGRLNDQGTTPCCSVAQIGKRVSSNDNVDQSTLFKTFTIALAHYFEITSWLQTLVFSRLPLLFLARRVPIASEALQNTKNKRNTINIPAGQS